jgi:hypothetical protein
VTELREWIDTIGTVIGAILIPVFILVGSCQINQGQLDAQLAAEDERAKDAMLRAYLDRMTGLLA